MRMRIARIPFLLCLLAPLCGNAAIVINEIFYHAPNDLDDLEYIELHNSGAQPADLGGWKFTKGIHYQFPANTRIESDGYLVICRNLARFKEAYGFAASGSFDESLSNNGERVELANAQGEKIDSVKYKSRAPWPVAADGYSSALERICPSAPGDLAANWAASPLSEKELKPAGTPGKQNANFSAQLPPVVSDVTFSPAHPAPGQAVTVEAEVRDKTGLREVTLRYRMAGSGFEQEETSVKMTKMPGHRYSATIPGQKENQIIRVRVQAVNKDGARRYFPGEYELRPAFSLFVHSKFEPGKIPLGLVFNVGQDEFKVAEKHMKSPNRGGMNEENQQRAMAQQMLENGIDLEGLWFELAINEQPGFEAIHKLQPVLAGKMSERGKLIEDVLESAKLEEKIKTLPEVLKSFNAALADAIKLNLSDEQGKKFADWQQQQAAAAGKNSPRQWGPEQILRYFIKLEPEFFKLSMQPDLTESQFTKLGAIYQAAVKDRAALIEPIKFAMKGDNEGDRDKLEAQFAAINEAIAKKRKSVLTADQEQQIVRWQEENSSFMPGRGGAKAPPPPRGRSAFVYVDQKSGEAELFDFVNVTERSAGYKIHFHKDHPLQGMTGINLIFEYNDRFVLAEPLAYVVYQRAGNAAELTDFVRFSIDGQLLGYQLLIEQPNRAFLHRNKLTGEGNMYKILWYERGVVGQHEKKTNTRSGHDDLLALVEALEKTRGDEQWAVIQKNFDVPQVVNYFAVNMCLSHWDGFFNNYFTYHETGPAGKWEMYPWDQDKTWGFYDGIKRGEVFFDMPLTFGMEGDVPPGWPKDRPPPRNFGANNWWRPGGVFSKPLLANPQFRKLFLARTKEIAESIYTEEVFFPIIDQMGDRLKEEVRLRASAIKEDPDKASERLQRNLQSLRDHVTKRRKFLLEQEEIRSLGKVASAAGS